jgi:hypothetical protein
MKKYGEYIFSFAALSALAALLSALGASAGGATPQPVSRESALGPSASKQPLACSNLLEENGNDFALRTQGTVAQADCLFVGCGGLY